MRKIIHIDMDAFFASVEQRDNPSLRGKPVAVGGSPDKRGVVAAASYEARKFGVHSAMPSRTAIQKCPQLLFVKPRFDVYRSISEQIRNIFYEYTDLVEPLSLDEAYLDVTVNKMDMPSATLLAREIKDRIWDELHLTASAGVSLNKFLAKTASGLNKPNGLTLIPPAEAEAFVAKLPVESFYGIGHVTAEKMHQLGISSGADLRTWTEVDLVRKFGKAGSFYFSIVRGSDDRPVVPNRVRKSIGAEESYADDLSDRYAFVTALSEIVVVLAERMERSQARGRTLTLKVKYADYQQVTRSRTLSEPISDHDEMLNLALELLADTEVENRHARLLGLTISNLDGAEGEDDGSEYVQLTIDFG